MAAIVTLGVLANSFWGVVQRHVLSYATNTSVSGLLQETNEERAGGGLENLSLNSKLNNAAQTKANDMASRDYWSHNTPEGNPPWVFFTNAGYDYSSAGENLAYGFDNSSDTVVGWMNSPGHKANIMNTSYQEVGFGIANSANYQGTGPETIVVAMYGHPQVASAATPVASAPPTQTAPAPKPASTPAVAAAPEPEESTPVAEPNATPVAANEDTKDSAAPVVTAQKVARVQLLAGSTAAWSSFAVSMIAAVAVMAFLMRHGLMLRRVLVKSEAFVHKHPILDISLVAIATIGIVLIQTDGMIR